MRRTDANKKVGKQGTLPRTESGDRGDCGRTRFDCCPLARCRSKDSFDNIEKDEQSSINKTDLKSRDSKKAATKKNSNSRKAQEDQTPRNRHALQGKKRNIEDTCESRCNAADMVMRLQALTNNLLGFNTEGTATGLEELSLSESVVAQQMELLRRFSGYAARLLNISESLFELVNSANKTEP